MCEVRVMIVAVIFVNLSGVVRGFEYEKEKKRPTLCAANSGAKRDPDICLLE